MRYGREKMVNVSKNDGVVNDGDCMSIRFVKPSPPSGTRMEADGTRTVMFSADVMVDGGERFFATFRRRQRVAYDPMLRMWVVDMDGFVEAVKERWSELRRRSDWRLAF